MAGIIREAKDILGRLKKTEKEIEKSIQATLDQMGQNPSGFSKGFQPPTVEEMMASHIDRAVEQFRRECILAMRLRDVAMEVGLIQPKQTTHPQIEASPSLVGRYCMITIRPAPRTCFATFREGVFKFVERGLFVGGEYAFEQLGENDDELGEGFHCHIVAEVKGYVQVKEIVRDAKTDIKVPHICQVGEDEEKKKNARKFFKTERDLEYSRNYIRGRKHNDEKEAAISWNPKWRMRECLNDLYVFGEWSAPHMGDTYEDDDPESRPSGVIIEEVI